MRSSVRKEVMRMKSMQVTEGDVFRIVLTVLGALAGTAGPVVAILRH